MGTAAYMSPEQAEGRKLDGRSDIFSFGSVLYEMTTGRKPFTGESRLAMMTKILNEDPAPPSQFASSITRELEKAILRCLRKDPARRYQTMADLKVVMEDLEAESASGPQTEVSALRVPSWRRWAWAALLPATVIAVYFVWLALRAPPARGADAIRRAHHVSGRGTLSFVFSRRQPRGVHLERTQTG